VTGTAHVSFDPESLLGSLMENVPGAVYRCEVDADWTMLGIGDDIETITGYAASEFIGSSSTPDSLSCASSRAASTRPC
jgi:hypothetical protein